MKQLVISCSLSATSHSAIMARVLTNELQNLESEVELIDLRGTSLPFCDADLSYSDDNVVALTEKILQASAVTLAVPVYNYDVGGAARNLLAMTGSAWENKIVGFVAAAGGERSYMSVMPIANSLMLDFRCVIVPRYVYASRRSFAEGELRDEKVAERLAGLAGDLVKFALSLGPVLE